MRFLRYELEKGLTAVHFTFDFILCGSRWQMVRWVKQLVKSE